MRTRAVLPYFFLLLLNAHANPCWTAGLVVRDRTYQLSPSDEDWSFLRDPALREDFGDPIKYIRLRNHRDDWRLSIGGETRQDWERIGNDNWASNLSRTPSSSSGIWGISMFITANTFAHLFN